MNERNERMFRASFAEHQHQHQSKIVRKNQEASRRITTLSITDSIHDGKCFEVTWANHTSERVMSVENKFSHKLTLTLNCRHVQYERRVAKGTLRQLAHGRRVESHLLHHGASVWKHRRPVGKRLGVRSAKPHFHAYQSAPARAPKSVRSRTVFQYH